MDIENLEKLDFSKLSLFDTPIGKIVQSEQVAMLLKQKSRTTDYAVYIEKVHDAISNLVQSFDDIDVTIKLIEFAHPKIKSFKMTKVDRGDYLKYLFENYFFRLPKFKDQLLNLLNMVYNMGMFPSNGLEKKVRAYQPIKDAGLLYFLDYFDEAFIKIKPLRDTIAHRTDLTDSSLTMLSSYQLVKFDEGLYDTLLRGMISHSYIFKKTQSAFKKTIITLLLTLEKDFNFISGSLAR